MKMQRYFPSPEGDQIMWLNNLASKLPGYYTALGIDTAGEAMLTLVMNWLIWTWSIFLPARRQEGPTATKWRNQLANGPADPTDTTMPPSPSARLGMTTRFACSPLLLTRRDLICSRLLASASRGCRPCRAVPVRFILDCAGGSVS